MCIVIRCSSILSICPKHLNTLDPLTLLDNSDYIPVLLRNSLFLTLSIRVTLYYTSQTLHVEHLTFLLSTLFKPMINEYCLCAEQLVAAPERARRRTTFPVPCVQQLLQATRVLQITPYRPPSRRDCLLHLLWGRVSFSGELQMLCFTHLVH